MIDKGRVCEQEENLGVQAALETGTVKLLSTQRESSVYIWASEESSPSGRYGFAYLSVQRQASF